MIWKENINTATLQDLLPTEAKYDNSQIASVTEWINLSSPIEVPDFAITKATKENPSAEHPYGRVHITMQIPNPLLFQDLDYTKVYYLSKSSATKDNIQPFDIDNNSWCRTFQYGIDNTIFTSSEKYVDMHLPVRLSSEATQNKYLCMRIAFEYEENGQIKYIYSPIFAVIYNEL